MQSCEKTIGRHSPLGAWEQELSARFQFSTFLGGDRFCISSPARYERMAHITGPPRFVFAGKGAESRHSGPTNRETTRRPELKSAYLPENLSILQLLYNLSMSRLLILWVNLWHNCVDPSHVVRVSLP
jgi:hypothetical protein